MFKKSCELDERKEGMLTGTYLELNNRCNLGPCAIVKAGKKLSGLGPNGNGCGSGHSGGHWCNVQVDVEKDLLASASML
jgi:hypothetical protein